MGIINRTVEVITRLATNRKLLSEMEEHAREGDEIRHQLREVITRLLDHSDPEATLIAVAMECKHAFGAERLEQACNSVTPKTVSAKEGK